MLTMVHKLTEVNVRKGRNRTELQLDLYGATQAVPPAATETLEQRLAEVPSRYTYTDPINLFTDYGISSEWLATFRSTPGKTQEQKNSRMKQNYRLIETFFYGLNNMESLDGLYGIPHEMLTRMKRAEIAALYIAIGDLKRVGAKTEYKDHKYVRLIDTPADKFEGLMSELVYPKLGYKGLPHPIKVMLAKDKKYHQGIPAFYDRMRSVSYDSRLKFIESLKLKPREPGKTNRHFKYEYRINNIEGPHEPWEKPDLMGIDIHRVDISKFFGKLYKLNTKAAR